jgi:hypothetical protein
LVFLSIFQQKLPSGCSDKILSLRGFCVLADRVQQEEMEEEEEEEEEEEVNGH